ncbi:molybdopterin-dependent oxidoreductase [Defluviimonas sp. WL0002]|uniref:Molybdopterin-dependent oxidoreductase n=1 Tax=Albidovulum marisflavi TaxID=2984159 RepID=A0ABT2ZBA5_9RHOB|nr:molybdopterin-dependent oxidoreductase [Defluviimonas sp. WL0002]MCV2868425.1 molybdopterin-dependent oxidoreductase [Defluviimonas sp. WL0002]
MPIDVPRVFLCVIGSGFLGLAAAAQQPLPLPPPTGEVVLRVCGEIEVRNEEDCAVFDMDSLRAIGHVHLKTSTIWTEGVQEFEGIRLKHLLDRVGVQGELIWASAANDYGADIPVSDATEDGPILAYMMNEELMSLREKGPLWIVYPFDDDSSYRTDLIYSRSVWQLVSLDIRN